MTGNQDSKRFIHLVQSRRLGGFYLNRGDGLLVRGARGTAILAPQPGRRSKRARAIRLFRIVLLLAIGSAVVLPAFAQAAAPSAVTIEVFATGATTATVEGQVDPDGEGTTFQAAYDLAGSEWCTSSGSKGSPAHTPPIKLTFTDFTQHGVSVDLSGLTGGDEYCAELVAINNSGTARGGQVFFTAGAPSVRPFGVRSTGATTTTVEGEVNPAGQSTTYHVSYDLASSQWCASLGSKGSATHSTSPVSLGFTDTRGHSVNVGLESLSAGSKYCAELIAANGSATGHGSIVSFTAGAPSVEAFGEPRSTDATTVTLEGAVNPAGQSTTYYVSYDLSSSEWCTSFGSKGSPTHSTTPLTLGFADTARHFVRVTVSGLSAGSKYCAELSAAAGSVTSQGFTVSFTAGTPSAISLQAFATSATTANVAGQVDPAGQSTAYHVSYDLASSEWCTSFGFKGSPIHSTAPVTLGFTDASFHTVSIDLGGLTAGAEYCFALVAANNSGTGELNQTTFTAGAPLAFITLHGGGEGANSVFATSPTTATVEGEVNPAGQTTTYHVAYDLASSEWCTSGGSIGSPEHSTSPVTLGFTGASPHPVSVKLTGLTAGSEYCAELVAVNEFASSHGFAVLFTAGLPYPFVLNAFATTTRTATVEAELNPAGQTTQYHLAYDVANSEWCKSGGFQGTPAQSTEPETLEFTDSIFHQVQVGLGGLTVGTEYCAAVIATNGSGTAKSGTVFFTAGFPTAITSQALATGATTATVEGEVNPAGQPTKYDVAYDLAGSEWCTNGGGPPAHSTTSVALDPDGAFHPVSVGLSGLSAGTEYCAELVAVNGSGTTHGFPVFFTTGPGTPAGSSGGGGSSSGSTNGPGGGGVLGSTSSALPAPVFGHTANVQPISGSVLIELPGTTTFIPLSAAKTVPLGTIIDATNGTVQLTSAADAHGHTETGLFYGGVFRVTQITARSNLHGGQSVVLTVLTLVGPLPTGCKAKRASHSAASGHAHAAARRLWGDAKGNFRTVGHYASATVRGTKWLTEDTCAGTLIRVARGVVSVEDFPHHRTLLLRAPHSFLSHPGRGG